MIFLVSQIFLFDRFKKYPDEKKEYYFIQFTENVKEIQLQNQISVLNTTPWYQKYNNFDLLRFEMKNQRVTRTKGMQSKLFFIADRLYVLCLLGRAKTKLCKHFMETGTCKRGETCDFAHGPEELNQ